MDEGLEIESHIDGHDGASQQWNEITMALLVVGTVVFILVSVFIGKWLKLPLQCLH